MSLLKVKQVIFVKLKDLKQIKEKLGRKILDYDVVVVKD